MEKVGYGKKLIDLTIELMFRPINYYVNLKKNEVLRVKRSLSPSPQPLTLLIWAPGLSLHSGKIKIRFIFTTVHSLYALIKRNYQWTSLIKYLKDL